MRNPRPKQKTATLEALRRHWFELTSSEIAAIEQYARTATKREKYHNRGDRHARTS